MKLKQYLFAMAIASIVSCVDMDIPPMSDIGDKEVLGTEAGVVSYMARLYSELPMEDFRYNTSGLYHQTMDGYRQLSCLSGEAISRATTNAAPESEGFWNDAYLLIREANYFIENMPEYAGSHRAEDVKHYISEARFARAYAYFALAKRYGGVPLVDKVIDYPGNASIEETKLFRASEQEIWDFIASDLDFCIENMHTKSQSGRANKYVAAAFKSRAMLYAGSIAKYNEVEASHAGKRYCGIPSTRAADYFRQAFEASCVVDDGGYSLYKADWSATDKVAQATNFTNLFLKPNKEWIFIKGYSYPASIHSYDCLATPVQFMTSGGTNSQICPTLDFVEMFDGFSKTTSGTFESMDANGKYKYFESTFDAFKSAEPRLLGTVLMPGDLFKNKTIDIRRGVYTGDVTSGITALWTEGGRGAYENDDRYDYNNSSSVLKLVSDEQGNNEEKNLVTLFDGTKVKRAGLDGYVTSAQNGCCVSGFYVKKYLNPAQVNAGWKMSSQTWIDIRYAEILLNRAEAAAELITAGETTNAKTGKSYKTEAFTVINLIRERGGATLLDSENNLDIDEVKKERRKELAFEHHTYWDLRRWRVLHEEQDDRRYRILQPFLVAANKKVILDARYMEQDFQYKYDAKHYYQKIPTYEVSVNTNCKQNPGQL